MTYQPLARKYRPNKFNELLGQDSVTKALAGAVKIGRIPHAVIFSGVRGIGKTSTARLFAKALNCDEGPTAEPCGVCASCKAITAGVHEDVLEIDGASHNGVDEVRALQETIQYVPQRSRYKVYLIDEVHMLSTSAFNALLKTLEEPPEHVVFIFATTELHKVPQTVIGRCQTFYLKKLTTHDMVSRMTEILLQESIPFDAAVLPLVAKEGHGSMRDALTFLDQVIAIGGGEVSKNALQVLATDVSIDIYLDLLNLLLSKDARAAIAKIEQLDQAGSEFKKVTEQLAAVVRHALIAHKLGLEALQESSDGLSQGDAESLANILDDVAPFDLNRIFRFLVSCRSELDGSELDRFIFENYILEWCFDPGIPTIDEILNGEQQLSSLVEGQQSSSHAESGVSEAPQARSKPKSLRSLTAELNAAPVKKDKLDKPKAEESMATATQSGLGSKQFPETWRQLVDEWKRQKPLQARKLEEVHPLEYSQEKITVVADSASMIGASLLDQSQQQQMTQIFKELFGFSGQFRAVDKGKIAAADLKKLSIDIESEQQAPTDPIDLEKPPVERPNLPSRLEDTAPVPDQSLPETILQEKKREVELARKKLTEETLAHPATKAIEQAFGARARQVEITDPALS